jgi:GT2 family glycosyltransferase
MKYSVIIRTFNSEATLPETLASLDAQTVRPERLIFVDSGSSDGTLALVPENSVVHRYVGTESCASRNRSCLRLREADLASDSFTYPFVLARRMSLPVKQNRTAL